jgi:cell wall-associated NlpC family hydrolase
LSYTLRPGDLLFIRGDSLPDRVIESVTHSPYSHVAGFVKENELIEAQGLRRTGYQALDFYTAPDIYTCDVLTDDQRRRIVQYVTEQVGTRYDWLLILWEGLHYLLHLTLPYHEHKRFICSTLWADAYRTVGIDLCPWTRYPTPGDLARSFFLRKVN